MKAVLKCEEEARQSLADRMRVLSDVCAAVKTLCTYDRIVVMRATAQMLEIPYASLQPK